MNEIAAIVEGQTEQSFIQEQLQPHLSKWGAHIWAKLPGRSRRHGGVRPWQSIKGDIIRTLKERGSRICTIMFDFYAMPLDWPGRTEAAMHIWQERGPLVEQAIHQDIVAEMGMDFNPARFIPYIQIHEFEALLFSDACILADTVSFDRTQAEKMKRQIQSILKEFASPEEIDDGIETAPSKRISSLEPGYRKTLHGPIIVERIGLEKLRRSCAHFDRWIARLEQATKNYSEGNH